jgi:hypothetical protein
MRIRFSALLLAALAALCMSAPGFAHGHGGHHSYHTRSYRSYHTRSYHSYHSRIHRSREARSEFERETGFPHGRPGYVIDHIVPLACGGSDSPSNMQWQAIAAGKAKDKWERKGCSHGHR